MQGKESNIREEALVLQREKEQKEQRAPARQQIGDYLVIRQLGNGSFGVVYEVEKDNQKFAIKTQQANNKKQMLMLQFTILSRLQQEKPEQSQMWRFPQVYEFKEEEHFSYLVMQKLQMSLHDLALEVKNKFQSDVIIQIMFGTLSLVHSLHEIGYIYRDIKPGNFMISRRTEDKPAQICLIDYGLCKQYFKNGEHIALKTDKKMIGTVIFCSRNAHQGLELSRRDDLIAWLYMIVYLVRKLPWEDQGKGKEKESKQAIYAKIGSIKEQHPLVNLIQKEDKLPRCMHKIVKMVEKTEYQARPDYEGIIKLLKEEYCMLTGKQHNLESEQFSLKSKRLREVGVKPIKINFKIPEKKKGDKPQY